MGITYLMCSLILFLFKEVNHKEITNPEIFIGMVVTGGSLIGIALAEHFKNFKTKTNDK